MNTRKMDNRSFEEIINRITEIADSDRSSLNRADVFEIITYLIILKYLDHIELTEDKDSDFSNWLMGDDSIFAYQAERFKWRNWIELAKDDRFELIVDSIFPYLNSLDDDSLLASFFQGADFRDIDRNLLNRLVDEIDKINFENIEPRERSEFASLLTESFLNEDSSRLGQFVTPRELRKLMINLLPDNNSGDVLDPACGSGLLLADLVNADNYQENGISKIHGIDISRRMMNFARFNFIMNGLQSGEIFRANSLSENDKKSLPDIIESYDVVISQPPIGLKVRKGETRSELKSESNKGDLLFLELIMNALKSEGVACVTLAPTFFYSSDSSAKTLRKRLVDYFTPKIIIKLPKNVFSPYHSVGSYLLLFHRSTVKAEQAKEVIICDLDQEKISIDEEFKSTFANLIKDWKLGKNLKEFKTVDSVSVGEIRDNSYYLNLDRYFSQSSKEDISRDKEEIINDLISKEEEILQKLKSLREKIMKL